MNELFQSLTKRYSLFCFLLGLTVLTARAGDTKPAVKDSSCEMCKDTPGISLASFTETKWIESSSRKPLTVGSFVLTNQDGGNSTASSIFSKPTAITFLYTRCDNPNKCPLAASTMVDLQNKLQETGLLGKIRLCVITYDPEHDTPEVLKEYAADKGFRTSDDVQLLRPEVGKVRELFKAMEVAVNYDKERVNVHGLQLLLLDKQGRLAKSFITLIWSNDEVVKHLKVLAEEP